MSKPKNKYFSDEEIKPDRLCDNESCGEAGEYRAPKSRLIDRGGSDDYYWLCLKHIREFNKSWNFFDGMSDGEVLKYKDEDITGHRPTWKLGSRTAGAQKEFMYDDPFNFQKETGASHNNKNKNGRHNSNDRSELDTQELEALATLDLEPGSSLKDIKKRHKKLAKKYHPDIRGGDKQAEEIMKTINQAYTHLLSCANS